MDSLCVLPSEVLHYILQYLAPPSFSALTKTASSYSLLLRDDLVWKRMVQNYYQHSTIFPELTSNDTFWKDICMWRERTVKKYNVVAEKGKQTFQNFLRENSSRERPVDSVVWKMWTVDGIKCTTQICLDIGSITLKASLAATTNLSPTVLLSALLEVRQRPKWDPLLNHATVVHQISKGMDIVHLEYLGNTDLVFLRKIYYGEEAYPGSGDHSVLLLEHSVEDVEVTSQVESSHQPANEHGPVRLIIHGTGFFIQSRVESPPPHAPATLNPSYQTTITYVLQIPVEPDFGDDWEDVCNNRATALFSLLRYCTNP